MTEMESETHTDMDTISGHQHQHQHQNQDQNQSSFQSFNLDMDACGLDSGHLHSSPKRPPGSSSSSASSPIMGPRSTTPHLGTKSNSESKAANMNMNMNPNLGFISNIYPNISTKTNHDVAGIHVYSEFLSPSTTTTETTTATMPNPSSPSSSHNNNLPPSPPPYLPTPQRTPQPITTTNTSSCAAIATSPSSTSNPPLIPSPPRPPPLDSSNSVSLSPDATSQNLASLSPAPSAPALAIFLQPLCNSHKWIRSHSSDHLFERPERLRAVMVGISAFIARLEEERGVEEVRMAIQTRSQTGIGVESESESRSKSKRMLPDVEEWNELIEDIRIIERSLTRLSIKKKNLSTSASTQTQTRRSTMTMHLTVEEKEDSEKWVRMKMSYEEMMARVERIRESILGGASKLTEEGEREGKREEEEKKGNEKRKDEVSEQKSTMRAVKPDLSNLLQSLSIDNTSSGKSRSRAGKTKPPHHLAPRPFDSSDDTTTGRHQLSRIIHLAPVRPLRPPPATEAPFFDQNSSRSTRSAASPLKPSSSSSTSTSSAVEKRRQAALLALNGPGSILLKNPAVAFAHADPSVLRAPFPSFAVPPPATARHSTTPTTPPSTAPNSECIRDPTMSTPPIQPAPTLASNEIPHPEYLRHLLKWALEAPKKIKEVGCEIPSDRGMDPNDLYLGPGSVDAIEGCIKTVCEAIDLVCSDIHTEPEEDPDNKHKHKPTPKPTPKKAFCAIRPPGHHCGQESPSGFCYVNNVMVAAMHAYLFHGCDRAIVLDFDLHHGNGTQSILMGLNEVTHTHEMSHKSESVHTGESERRSTRRRGWKGFYGSLHDIYSYPCESGDLELVRDASINLSAHGQHICNIHLDTYTSETDFYERLYPKYLEVLKRAREFMEMSDADPGKTVVLISAGFDACEHEYQEMQRHERRVPASFFSRFTSDIASFANKHCSGRVVSLLEGGYSDKALTSGTLSHLSGFFDDKGLGGKNADYWDEEALYEYASATPKKRNGDLALASEEGALLFPRSRRIHEVMGELHRHESAGLVGGDPTMRVGKVAKNVNKHTVMGRTIKTRSAAATPETKKTAPERATEVIAENTPVESQIRTPEDTNPELQPQPKPKPQSRIRTHVHRLIKETTPEPQGPDDDLMQALQGMQIGSRIENTTEGGSPASRVGGSGSSGGGSRLVLKFKKPEGK